MLELFGFCVFFFLKKALNFSQGGVVLVCPSPVVEFRATASLFNQRSEVSYLSFADSILTHQE